MKMKNKQFDHFIGVAVKAHGGKADYIEWTYGYSFVNWNDKAGKMIKRKR